MHDGGEDGGWWRGWRMVEKMEDGGEDGGWWRGWRMVERMEDGAKGYRVFIVRLKSCQLVTNT